MKTIIQLGKYGDIMTLLPLLLNDSERGPKPSLMVSKDFASILEGVSYVEPVIFDGKPHEVAKAYTEAKEKGLDPIVSQVNGPAEDIRNITYSQTGDQGARSTSFQKEMWRAIGRLKEWDDYARVRLIFDRRDKAREEMLASRVLPQKKKPVILVATEGASSPFPYKALILELLRMRFEKTHSVVSLDGILADRIYDMVGLYESAAVLVAIDSSPLQLARAVPSLPVCALANDRPSLWHGTSWQPQHVFYCRYSDFPERAIEMLDTIESARPLKSDSPRIVHVWNQYADVCEKPTGQAWFRTPIEKGACGRDSALLLGDRLRVPYLKDCIRMGLQRTHESDWLCISRPMATLADKAELTLMKHEACFAYRLEVGNGPVRWKPTVDLFCAKSNWWRGILAQIPDYLFGTDVFWSNGMRALFTKNGAVDVTGLSRTARKK